MTSNVTNLTDARSARERLTVNLAGMTGPCSPECCDDYNDNDYTVTGATFHTDTGWTLEITRPGQYATETLPEVSDIPDSVTEALIDFLEMRADAA